MKKILKWIIGIVVVLLLVSLFLPSKMRVERSLIMRYDADYVFQQINVVKNWEKWSPWHNIDPAMKLKYEGPVMGVGASYLWESDNKKVGKGKLTLLGVEPNDSIAMEMDFMENGKAMGYFNLLPVENGTKVSWSMTSDIGWNPMGKYFALFMKGIVGKDFELGLQNMAKAVAAYADEVKKRVMIEEAKLSAMNYIAIRESATLADLEQKLDKCYGELFAYVKKNKLKIAGYPFIITHEYDEVTFKMVIGVPVDKIAVGEGGIIAGEFKEQNAVMAKYTGPYSEINMAYDGLQ